MPNYFLRAAVYLGPQLHVDCEILSGWILALVTLTRVDGSVATVLSYTRRGRHALVVMSQLIPENQIMVRRCFVNSCTHTWNLVLCCHIGSPVFQALLELLTELSHSILLIQIAIKPLGILLGFGQNRFMDGAILCSGDTTYHPLRRIIFQYSDYILAFLFCDRYLMLHQVGFQVSRRPIFSK